MVRFEGHLKILTSADSWKPSKVSKFQNSAIDERFLISKIQKQIYRNIEPIDP